MSIYTEDFSYLMEEGWKVGAHWSGPGVEGYYIRHPDHYSGEWIRIAQSPCEDDSLRDEAGWIGECEPCDTATEALLVRLGDDVD